MLQLLWDVRSGKQSSAAFNVEGKVGDIVRLETSNRLTHLFKAPFIETQGSTQTIVATVANQVFQTIKPPPTANTSFSWLDVFNLTIATAAVFAPEASEVLGLVAGAGNVAAGLLSSSPSGNPATVVFAVEIEGKRSDFGSVPRS